MSTLPQPYDITPDVKRAQDRLVAERATVEIAFEAGYRFAVEQMTPPPPRPHLRLVTLADVTAASVAAIQQAARS